MARTSSLNCLPCRNPYQTPHSLNVSPPCTEKPIFSPKSASLQPLPKNRLLETSTVVRRPGVDLERGPTVLQEPYLNSPVGFLINADWQQQCGGHKVSHNLTFTLKTQTSLNKEARLLKFELKCSKCYDRKAKIAFRTSKCCNH